MGQFSWFTQDTNVQIFNDWDEHGDRQTIHMVDPRDGTDYVETGYEGYGVFGGRDFYELLAELNNTVPVVNNWKELTAEEIYKRRLKGINLWFDSKRTESLMSPILVEDYSTWKRYIGIKPDDDPNQGWHIEDNWDEEDE